MAHIKNMVCSRCVMVVKGIAKKSGLEFREVNLGEIVFEKQPGEKELNSFNTLLKEAGFELISNRTGIIVNKIKKSVLKYVRALEDSKRKKLSDYIVENLNYDYSYLSNLFSSIEGITIEQFFIQQRIEKAKELLVYDQLSLSEIAFQLGYSSVHHLSSQFKKITGLTPTHFKKVGSAKRKPLDQV